MNVLGIALCPTIKGTMTMYLRRSLRVASNRRLTILQKAKFFNNFNLHNFIHLKKVFFLSKKKLKNMQSECRRFIESILLK